MDPSNWKISQFMCMVFPTVSSEGHTVTDSISRLIVCHIAVVKADCYVECPVILVGVLYVALKLTSCEEPVYNYYTLLQ